MLPSYAIREGNNATPVALPKNSSKSIGSTNSNVARKYSCRNAKVTASASAKSSSVGSAVDTVSYVSPHGVRSTRNMLGSNVGKALGTVDGIRVGSAVAGSVGDGVTTTGLAVVGSVVSIMDGVGSAVAGVGGSVCDMVGSAVMTIGAAVVGGMVTTIGAAVGGIVTMTGAAVGGVVTAIGA